jgi:CRP-like cAMP-binding protein
VEGEFNLLIDGRSQMKILQVLNNISPLNEKDVNNLLEICKNVHINKGEYWIKEGKKNNYIAFIEEGYLRKFYLKDGNEITDFFYFENDFSADLPSIIGNTNSDASIIAMQKSNLTTFSYYDFHELSKHSPTLEHIYRVIVEQTFVRFYKRTASFILHTPKERYYELFVSSPHVLQRATQYHIASYLGITPQHLSRLRKEKTIS